MEKGMISVDKWSYGSQAYFLTHLHSDHTAGLSSTWHRGPLFCSRLTARLFPSKFPSFDLSLLRILEIGTCYSLSLTSPSSSRSVTISVRAIDAHHCPGSVMYLFRGDFGNMLYTGDFRWERISNGSEIRRSMLLDALKNEQLNILYLDNTYCNPQYNFPPREVAAKQIVDIIIAHPEHQVIIGIDSLGKEDLLLHISQELNTKDLIELLRPINIKGIVSSSSCCIDPLSYFGHLCGSQQASWRLQQKLKNEVVVDSDAAPKLEVSAESTTPTAGMKRRMDQVDFFGIRVSRVSLLRRLSRGVRITEND